MLCGFRVRFYRIPEMVICPTFCKMITRAVVALSLASAVTGCDRNAAELVSLKADNERLRAEIANLRRKASGAKDPESAAGKPDQILSVSDLWTQRFEDHEFRARQRLSDKTLRITGILDGISGGNVLLYGVGKSRNVQVSVNLEKGYAARIEDGLDALEKGVTITVQGKLLYDRMELNDATIVDKATGAVLNTEQLQAYGQVGPNGLPVPPPLPENQ